MELLKNYFVELIIYIGEYETYSNYTFQAINESEAREFIEDGCNDDNDERHTELRTLVEVSDDEFAVLRKYI
jgi:hypothetical protein|tara:strand:- start:155 stop:370 length:216 start_codon:yes stop_codon:yes gene_type:complete